MKNADTNMLTKTLALTAAIVMTACTLSSCASSDASSSGTYGGNAGTTQENISGENKYDMNTRIYEDGDGYTGEAEQENTNEYIDEEINTEEYSEIVENSFLSAEEYPLSTFSTDVDTASYTNVRRMIENLQSVDPDAVRTEEFINYFKYDYTQPQGDDKISITTQLSDCPWNDEAKLLLVGLQAAQAQTQDISSNVVFLIDVSGSMNDYNKLPLVQEAFKMLADELDENDTISIVTYAGGDEVVLEGVGAGEQNYDAICDALDSLTAGGATAGADGINTAYEIAEKYFIEDGNNRVILATDGDLNVGVSSQEELTSLIEQKRDNGVFLSVLGFGTGNLKDNKLEALADNGNGNYAYIDSVDEARRVLVTEFNATMFTVAKDTKVQLEFNPLNVEYYRLVGYENRLLADEDFEDDTKDAGDVGSGQQVTALYEIIASDSAYSSDSGKTLKYQSDVSYPTNETVSQTQGLDGELLTVSVRYKEPDEDESKLIDKAVTLDSYTQDIEALQNTLLASSAAMFAMTLRGSTVQQTLSADMIIQNLENVNADALSDGAKELLNLVTAYGIYYEN